MKKYFIIIIVFISFMLTIQSCADFLDEDNKTGQVGDLVYGSSSGINGLVASCYSFARGWYGKEAGLGLSEMGTDLFYYGYDNKQKSLLSYNLTPASLDDNSSDNACLDHYWELFYCAVDVCNTAYKYAHNNINITENVKNRYLGEVYFLRAFYYFHMVNIWGPVPYNTVPADDINYKPERMSEEEIYSNILTDLDNSIQSFTAAAYTTKADGRANLWSARALKARVLLYAASWLTDAQKNNMTNVTYKGQDLYALAQAEAQAVIESPIASFYPNYEDVWSMNNEDITVNNEAIFGIPYSSDITTTANCIPKRYKKDVGGNALDYSSLITRTGYTRGGSAMLLMFVGMWNNGADDLGGNGSEVFIRADKSSNFSVTHRISKQKVYAADRYSPYGRGFTRYLPSLYLWNLLEKHRSTDQRTEATLLTAYTIPSGLAGSSGMYPNMKDTAIYYCPLDGNSNEGKAKQAWAFQRYRIQFMTNGEIPVYSSSDPADALPTESPLVKSQIYAGQWYIKDPSATKPDTIKCQGRYNSYKIGGWCSFPGIKKFLDNVFNATYPTHDVSSRDAIVIRLAEMYLIKAECQLYTENGTNAMATINYLRNVRAISGQDNSLSGEATLETVLEERAIELCGEQQRWFDLKRTRTLVDRLTRYNAQAVNIDEHHLLRPIPQTEMDAVTNFSTVEGQGFWQNPGY